MIRISPEKQIFAWINNKRCLFYNHYYLTFHSWTKYIARKGKNQLQKFTLVINAAISFMVTAVFCYSLSYVPVNYLHDLLALLLASFSTFYLGLAICKKEMGAIIYETIIFFIIFFTALFGLYYSLFILGAGYMLNSIWNLMHYFFNVGVKTYKALPLCLFIINLMLCMAIIFFLF